MPEVGRTDVFERLYTQKFRAHVANFGEFVAYERDRGARDIGLHLVRSMGTSQKLSPMLCWFQLKGLMASTISKEALEKKTELSIPLDVKHLGFWFLQPAPTFVCLYLECIDQFLIINIKRYVTEKWGPRILKDKRKTCNVPIPTKSVLDDQAISLILREGDVNAWVGAFKVESSEAQLCARDFSVIWALGTAADRSVEHRMIYLDWQSKTRGQILIQERTVDNKEWITIRQHLEYMMPSGNLESAYPYLLLDRSNETTDPEQDFPDSGFAPDLVLRNGASVSGLNCGDEYFHYELHVALNELGQVLFSLVSELKEMGLIEIRKKGCELVSVAPWHHRAV